MDAQVKAKKFSHRLEPCAEMSFSAQGIIIFLFLRHENLSRANNGDPANGMARSPIYCYH
jgi:hypothetical protein